jgi:predicted DNA-binding protein
MTTRKPANRLTLTISDELKQALADLNQATGVAAATFVAEIVEGQTQMISELAEAASKAKTDPLRTNEIFHRVLLQAVQQGAAAGIEIIEEGAKLRTYNRKDDRP